MVGEGALSLIGSVGLVVTTVAGVAFPVLYWLRSPFRTNALGRDTMVFSVAVAAVLVLSVATTVFGLSGTVRWAFRAGVWSVLAYVFVRRLVLLVRIQNDFHSVREADLERAARRAGLAAEESDETSDQEATK